MGDPVRLLSPYIILKGRDRNKGRVFENARQDVQILKGRDRNKGRVFENARQDVHI